MEPSARPLPSWREAQVRLAIALVVVIIVPPVLYWHGETTTPLEELLGASDYQHYQLAYSSPLPSSTAPPSKSEVEFDVMPVKPVDNPHFHVTWDDYRSTSGQLRVMSAAQDHRRFPADMASTHPFAFPSMSQLPHARIFQFHASHASGKNPFNRTAVWIYSLKGMPLPQLPAHQPLDVDLDDDATGKFVVTKLEVECLVHQPHNWGHRVAIGARNSDLILRCIAFLPPEVVDQALCTNSFAHVGGTLRFPMDKIMHFPSPVSLFGGAFPPPPTPGIRFPSAPWRANGLAAPRVVRRASGEAAKARTCVWVPKKYSWDAADELWLLWMLDVVGVDFVSINFVPSKATAYQDNPALFNTTTTLEAVRARIDTHPGLSQRVLLVQSDAPGSPVTFDHAIINMHWDGFVRLQADCDYGFSIDPDEFVDLFDVETPHERIDIKTFIAQRNDTLHRQQAVCMDRLRVRRETQPGEADETLPPFLVRWLHYDSDHRNDLAHPLPREGLGKCLWKLRGNLQPYLHYPEEQSVPLEDVDLSRMLHVRLQAGYAAFNDRNHPGSSRPQDMR